MNLFCRSVDPSDSNLPLNKAGMDRAVLAIAAVAGVIFGDGLLLVGLVGLGIVALPFIWPVALGVLVGAAIIAGIAYALLHSSKAETLEIPQNSLDDDGCGPPLDTSGEAVFEMDPFSWKDDSDQAAVGSFEMIQPKVAPDRSTWIAEHQEIFFKRALEAEERFRGTGQIDDNALKYFVLALNIFYSRSCYLRVSQGKSFDEFDYCQKLNDKNPGLQIRTVCIEPRQGAFKGLAWVKGALTGNRVCLESHASVYLSLDGENWQYFDPKFIPLHDGLIEGGGVKVQSLIKGKQITEYKDLQGSPAQLQPLFNPIDCGVHVCRRIMQYFQGRQGDFLPVLTEDELRDLRGEFADLIRNFVIDPFENSKNWIEASEVSREIDEDSINAFRNQLFGLDEKAYDRAFF